LDSHIKQYGKTSIIVSILLILLSFFLIFRPLASINFIIMALGFIVVASGISHIITYFTSPVEFRAFSFELVRGILGIVAGIILISHPEWVHSFLPVIIGIWVIIESIINFQLSLNLKSFVTGGWMVMLILSILTVLLGIFIIVHPSISAAILTTFCGICLLISEILNIFEYVYIFKKMK